MFQKPPTPPMEPRPSRLGRSGIQKRNRGPMRADKDGDLDMDAASTIRKSRGRVPRVNRDYVPTPGVVGSKSSRDMTATGMQKAILREMGSRDTLRRSDLKTRLGRTMWRGRDRNVGEGLTQITVRGFQGSKAASNPDGGINDLLAFLERKASAPDASARDMVRIKKSQLDGDALIASVRTEDLPKFTRLDKFTFAGATLDIKHYQGGKAQAQDEADTGASSISTMLKAVLSRRYNQELKLLDLSHLGTDPELVNIGMFSTSSRESKFFPALMKVCDGIFTTAQQKKEAVVSVSLAGNNLTSIASVTTLAQTFPALINLDLSNNQLHSLSALEGWRWKFRQLDHLILSGNPLEAEVPSFKDDILKWYPTLRLLDHIPVRSSDEVKAATTVTLPIPVLGPSFRDEANIGETFVKRFFVGYDSDRSALANGYYDAHSTFSLNINASAPRAILATDQKSPSWDNYIKRSRNLTKVTHLPARTSRIHTGMDSIQQCWLTLPSTRHPDLLTESEKWCIECNSIPGLPDLSGQSLGGVGGLIVTVHGEFSEVDVSTGQTANKRSFDRTFILGAGHGFGGVRVLCDTFVLRAWGGSEAWKPEGAKILAPASSLQPAEYSIPFPEGFGVSGPGKTDEQVQKEILAVGLSKRTGMTLEYSGMCLEQSGWGIEAAIVAFEKVKANLPPDAFISL